MPRPTCHRSTGPPAILSRTRGWPGHAFNRPRAWAVQPLPVYVRADREQGAGQLVDFFLPNLPAARTTRQPAGGQVTSASCEGHQLLRAHPGAGLGAGSRYRTRDRPIDGVSDPSRHARPSLVGGRILSDTIEPMPTKGANEAGHRQDLQALAQEPVQGASAKHSPRLQLQLTAGSRRYAEKRATPLGLTLTHLTEICCAPPRFRFFIVFMSPSRTVYGECNGLFPLARKVM